MKRKFINKDGILLLECLKCGEYKNKECFCKKTGRPFGVRTVCKECDKIYRQQDYVKLSRKESSRKYHEQNREKEREYNKTYRKSHKEQIVAQLHKYPEKRKARVTLYNYLRRNNKIIKPDVCSICGNHSIIEAHHPDYTKWNVIIWCCKTCHALIHRGDLNIDDDKLTNVLND